MYNHQLDTFLQVADAGKSFYQDARYMIRYAKESQIRAKNAMQDSESILRMGTSVIMPNQFLMELWPEIRKVCPKLKFEMVNFENTPENAAVSIYHPFAQKQHLCVEDLYGQNLMLIRRNWSHAIPFGLLHATSPSPTIKEFLAAAAKVFSITAA